MEEKEVRRMICQKVAVEDRQAWQIVQGLEFKPGLTLIYVDFSDMYHESI